MPWRTRFLILLALCATRCASTTTAAAPDPHPTASPPSTCKVVWTLLFAVDAPTGPVSLALSDELSNRCFKIARSALPFANTGAVPSKSALDPLVRDVNADYALTGSVAAAGVHLHVVRGGDADGVELGRSDRVFVNPVDASAEAAHVADDVILAIANAPARAPSEPASPIRVEARGCANDAPVVAVALLDATTPETAPHDANRYRGGLVHALIEHELLKQCISLVWLDPPDGAPTARLADVKDGAADAGATMVIIGRVELHDVPSSFAPTGVGLQSYQLTLTASLVRLDGRIVDSVVSNVSVLGVSPENALKAMMSNPRPPRPNPVQALIDMVVAKVHAP